MILPRLIALTTACLALVLFSQATAQELPAPLEAAVSEAEAQDQRRFSYTQTFIWRDFPPVVDRYDASTDSWTRISGTTDGWDNPGPKKLRNWTRIESRPGELLYADYRGSFSGVKLIEETDETYTYSFTAGQENNEDLQDAEKNVLTRAVVDKGDQSIKSYLIKATQGFKPNAVSRLDEFVFEQTFERPAPGVAPVMTKVYWKAVGRQVLSKVDEELTIYYSDFEVVE
ncbi:hypothetical protein [Parvularcula sp. IMCC14364]|uniref:hypothetical protein n=1 Tax=Parvularcula sp. IMCC14364 TaxID=3067902 RepID=UPI00274207A4|nr:hypothetical protein [Parvularcula sp. IMCC14364]